MENTISREEWKEHIDEDDQRGRDVNELKLAMFGDPIYPDTVRMAVMPTMTRLNTYLDGITMLAKYGSATILFIIGVAGFAKTMGWL